MRFSQAYDPFRVVRASWRALQAAPVPMLIGGILMMLVSGGAGGGARFGTDASDWNGRSAGGAELGLILFLAVIVMMLAIGLWLFGCLVRVGFAGAVESVVSTGEATVGQVFESRGRWGRMVLTTLLQTVLTFAAVLPLMLGVLIVVGVARATEAQGVGPVVVVTMVLLLLGYLPVLLYIGLGLSLMPEATAIEGLSATEAMHRSWGLVRGNRLQLLVYYLVLALFGMLGILACCVGVLITESLVQIGQYESYLRLVRPVEDQTNWRLPAA